jgi:RNA recognition motif-containing protein
MDIFVGSLPFKIKSDQLKALFEEFGEVESVKIIMDKITRQNKGFGFVVMPNHHEAKLAIDALNGKEIMGRTIIVTVSEEKEPDNKKKKFGKGGTNFKGDFDKAKKEFPGKSGFHARLIQLRRRCSTQQPKRRRLKFRTRKTTYTIHILTLQL